jgi:hypothetical protein
MEYFKPESEWNGFEYPAEPYRPRSREKSHPEERERKLS